MKKISLLVLLFVFFITLTACDKETLKSSEFVDYSKQFTLDRDYENKSFFKDGIGEVEVVQFVDGDTTVFKDINLPASEQANYPEWSSFRVRFYGVDTPETKPPVEDFGIEAKNFTNTLLTNAKTIVLDSLSDKPRKDSYGSRYLAMVWVDGISINIELIQNGYTTNTPTISILDESRSLLLTKAWEQAREYDLNVYS